MNGGLAHAVGAILEKRAMPVFAQWEIADALIHGGAGAPPARAGGFVDWDLDKYPMRETYTWGRASVDVYKAVPLWPKACAESEQTIEDMKDAGTIGRHYLSTDGVMRQFRALWERQVRVEVECWGCNQASSKALFSTPFLGARAQRRTCRVLCGPNQTGSAERAETTFPAHYACSE